MHERWTGAPRGRLARLKQRREFLRVAAIRTSAARPGLVLQAARRDETSGDPELVRYGLTVSRKVGNAVTRNRARRRLRAVAEEILSAHGVAGVDYVLIGRRDSVRRPFAALIEDLGHAMRRVDCWRDGAAGKADGGAD